MGIKADVIPAPLILFNPFCREPYRKAFSQYGEDAIIMGISDTYNIAIEHYIDIGANHPWAGNATMAFYINGASGILVEPNAHLCDELRKYRTRDTVVNAGVSNDRDNGTEKKYYRVEGLETRNTFSENVAEHYIRNGFNVKTDVVKMISLNTLMCQYNKKINYINIDVESLEYDVLKDFDFEKYNVEFFNIEKGNDDVKALMLSKGYKLVSETPSNWIFVLNGIM
jgi:FkbM family methyltransferase